MNLRFLLFKRKMFKILCSHQYSNNLCSYTFKFEELCLVSDVQLAKLI